MTYTLHYSAGTNLTLAAGKHDHIPILEPLDGFAKRFTHPARAAKGGAGYYCNGLFERGKRTNKYYTGPPQFIVTDLDQGNWSRERITKTFGVLPYIAHTTATHCVVDAHNPLGEQRWRVLILLGDTVMAVADHKALTMSVYRSLGWHENMSAKEFDKCGAKVGQAMYWPTAASDAEAERYECIVSTAGSTWSADQVGQLVRAEQDIQAANTPLRGPKRNGVSSDIDQFNAAHDLEELMVQHGYTEGHGGRWVSPRSVSGVPSHAILHRPDGTPFVYSHRGTDAGTEWEACDAFDLFRLHGYGGDLHGALGAWRLMHNATVEVTGVGLPMLEFVSVKPSGVPRATIENVAALMAAGGITARFNDMSHRVELRHPGSEPSGGVQDGESDLVRLESRATEYDMPTSAIPGIVTTLARRDTYHPAREWIDRAPWDGQDRFMALAATVTTDREDLWRLLLRKWLVSAVAALYPRPGVPFKARGILVFQGTETLGKSAWLDHLMGGHNQFFLEGHHMDPGNKDHTIEAVSSWVVELGELESTLGGRGLPRLKAFITRQADQFRMPYGRTWIDYPRATVYCASVNQAEFLKDERGGDTRFWVIPVSSVDYKHAVDMQQLWAQILLEYRTGAQWWLTTEENTLLGESNSEFRDRDPIEERVLTVFPLELPRTHHYSATEIVGIIGFDAQRRGDVKKCAAILRGLGFAPYHSGKKRGFRMPQWRTNA